MPSARRKWNLSPFRCIQPAVISYYEEGQFWRQLRWLSNVLRQQNTLQSGGAHIICAASKYMHRRTFVFRPIY
eukprot:scaffold12330_cov83-Skeletonema_marinoi.AAC.22